VHNSRFTAHTEVLKAQFASRSEAGRYAANQRWNGHMNPALASRLQAGLAQMRRSGGSVDFVSVGSTEDRMLIAGQRGMVMRTLAEVADRVSGDEVATERIRLVMQDVDGLFGQALTDRKNSLRVATLRLGDRVGAVALIHDTFGGPVVFDFLSTGLVDKAGSALFASIVEDATRQGKRTVGVYPDEGSEGFWRSMGFANLEHDELGNPTDKLELILGGAS